jgi:hypothetical protein
VEAKQRRIPVVVHFLHVVTSPPRDACVTDSVGVGTVTTCAPPSKDRDGAGKLDGSAVGGYGALGAGHASTVPAERGVRWDRIGEWRI